MSEKFDENNDQSLPDEDQGTDVSKKSDFLSQLKTYSGEPPKMKKKRIELPLLTVVVIVLLSCIITFQVTYIAQAKKYRAILNNSDNKNTNSALISELDNIYEKYYIGDIDREKINDGLLTGYVYGTGDKYGNYMTAEEYAEYKETMSNNLVGIGISAIESVNPAGIEVVNVFKDSPASKAELKFGDIITEIDNTKVSEVGYNTAIDMVQGEVGSKLTLTVFDPSTSNTTKKELTRQAVKVETVIHKILDGNIGYIRITNFYADTPTEFKTAVEDLMKSNVSSLIFDVRGNPGGYLNAIVSVLDYLLPEGTIIRMTDSSGKFTTEKSDASCIDLPMTVLVNGGTASAAELFTSALMDYEKATVIGTQTYGKGTVTSMFQLSDGSAVYVSTQLYYPPKSDNFEGIGITPDEVVELSEEAQKTNLYKLDYDKDTQLQKAVEILKK